MSKYLCSIDFKGNDGIIFLKDITQGGKSNEKNYLEVESGKGQG
jgi:hypothetical protein